MEKIKSALAGFSGRELYHLLISEEGWTCVMKTLVRLRMKNLRFRAMVTENASVLRFLTFEKSLLFANAHSDIIYRQLERRKTDDRQRRFKALPRATQEFLLYGPKLQERQSFLLGQNLPADSLIRQVVIDSMKPKTPPAISRRVANFFRENGATKDNFVIPEKLFLTL